DAAHLDGTEIGATDHRTAHLGGVMLAVRKPAEQQHIIAPLDQLPKRQSRAGMAADSHVMQMIVENEPPALGDRLLDARAHIGGHGLELPAIHAAGGIRFVERNFEAELDLRRLEGEGPAIHVDQAKPNGPLLGGGRADPERRHCRDQYPKHSTHSVLPVSVYATVAVFFSALAAAAAMPPCSPR